MNVGAAIEIVGRDDFVALGADIDYRVKDCRGTRSQRQGGRSAFELSDPLLEDILGGVTYAGIDVAQFL